MPAKAPRILFLMRGSVFTDFGGAELQVSYLGQSCRDAGFDVHHAFEATTPVNPDNGQHYHALPPRGGDAFCGLNNAHVSHLMATIRPDLVYQRSRMAYTTVAERQCRRHHVPFVFQVATDNDCRRNRPALTRACLINSLNEWASRRAMCRAHTVIAQTTFQQSLLLETFKRPSIHLPSLAVDPGPPPAKPDRPLVLWLANFKRKKQPEHFVDLAAACADLSADFVMGGRIAPGHYDALRDRIDKQPNLRYIGEVPFAETHTWYRQAALVINTSEPNEGYPNAYIQAWLQEAPVLTLHCDPDDTLVRERIGRRCESLAQMIADVRELCNNPAERLDMGRRARLFACRQHAMDTIAPRYVDLFKSISRKSP
ncbi:MAG: glycosyltransferase family 4 protein [Verrucomicrobia bacterium]|nr:glycosyltransferase family 4 protein [Verrucomicrobiota bacterium]